MTDLKTRLGQIHEAMMKPYERIEALESWVDDAIARIAELEAALQAAKEGIDTWLHTYAGEFCNEAAVKASLERIGEYGTVGYIAHVNQTITAALRESG